MSGLGTSPSSTGSRDGGSSSRTGLQAAGPGDAARQQDVVPVVQATSVAETIMDTMRSLEKVSEKQHFLLSVSHCCLMRLFMVLHN